MITENRLNEIIKEETFRFINKLIKRKDTKKLIVRIFFEPELHATDVLTAARAITGSITIYTAEKTRKSTLGRSVIDAKINYYPIGMSNPKYIDFLAKSIKSIPGVSQVRILRIQGKKFVRDVGPIKVVY